MAFLNFTGLEHFLEKIKGIFASKDTFNRSSDGLVPHPNTITQTHYLREDGSWQVPPNTTYNSVSTATEGLAPKLSGDSTQYLNGAGNWTKPPDNDTTYTPASLGFGFGKNSTSTSTRSVAIANYELVVGGIVAVQFTYAVQANAMLNVNTRGAKYIYHRGAKISDGIIKAGDTAIFAYDGTQYQLLAIDPQRTAELEQHAILDSN